MKKKFLAIVMVVCMLGVSVVSGTLAYFTDTAEATNVFTVGNVDITLTEVHEVRNGGPEGGLVIDKSVKTDSGVSYSNIMPGNYMKKDVTVKNGANPAYVRVTVITNNLKEIDSAIDGTYENAKYSNGLSWIAPDGTEKSYSERGDDLLQKIYDDVFVGWNMSYDKVNLMGGADEVGMRRTIDRAATEELLRIDGVACIGDPTGAYTQVDKNNWYENETTTNQPGVYTGYYSAAADEYNLIHVHYLALDKNETYKVMDGLYCPEYFDQTQAQMFEDLEINVFVDAIQQEGFVNPEAAFTALNDAHPLTAVRGGDIDKDPTIIEREGVKVASYDEFKEAFANVDSTKVIVLSADIEIPADEKITIDSARDVAIELNGHNISSKSTGNTNPQELFLVKGTLTITGNGTVSYKHSGDNMGWNGMSTVLDITAGGVVYLKDGATIENLGGTDMNFGAHLNNWGTASLYMDNATIKAPYCAIRVFNSGYDMNNVVAKNSTISSEEKMAFWVHNYTAADFGSAYNPEAVEARLNIDIDNDSNVINGIIRYGFTDSTQGYPTYAPAEVSTTDDLKKVLENKGNVLLTDDIDIAQAEAGSNGYGKTGINVLNGQTIDGNGNSIGVNAWDTWDSAINTTGGLIKNIKVTSGMRGIFINHNSTNSEKVVLDNVIIDGTVYTISCDQGTNQGLEAYNSTFNGWTSYAATIGEVSFTDCNFGKGQGYAFCRPYAPTTFKNCDFAEGYEIDPRAAVSFENCTLNGEPLTAENITSLVTSNIENVTPLSLDDTTTEVLSVTVNGETVDPETIPYSEYIPEPIAD